MEQCKIFRAFNNALRDLDRLPDFLESTINQWLQENARIVKIVDRKFTSILDQNKKWMHTVILFYEERKLRAPRRRSGP